LNLYKSIRLLLNLNAKICNYRKTNLSFVQNKIYLYLDFKQQNVINKLKIALTNALIIRILNYFILIDEIISIINFSLKD